MYENFIVIFGSFIIYICLIVSISINNYFHDYCFICDAKLGVADRFNEDGCTICMHCYDYDTNNLLKK